MVNGSNGGHNGDAADDGRATVVVDNKAQVSQSTDIVRNFGNVLMDEGHQYLVAVSHKVFAAQVVGALAGGS
jgi:hypothetical protein